MGDFNHVLLKRQFDVKMSIDALTKIISSYKPQDYSIIQLGNADYKIVSNLSFGVGVPGLFNNGINIYALLKPSGPTETTITLTSRFRFELYVLIIVAIGLIAIVLFNNVTFWLIFLGPICLVWFWAVYRYQERTLADDFEDYLAKQPRMGWLDLQ